MSRSPEALNEYLKNKDSGLPMKKGPPRAQEQRTMIIRIKRLNGN